MKKTNLWLLASLFMGAIAFTACSSSDDTPDGPGTPTQQGGISPGTAVAPASMKMAALSGFVKDSEGNALSGVTVTSGTEKVVTGKDGGFVFEKVNSVNGRTIVKFTRAGYIEVVRSMPTTDSSVWEVVMSSNWGEDHASGYKDSGMSYNVETESGMKADFDSNNFKNDATGEEYTGYVQTDMTYLNPDNENFADMMPGGDLAAVRSQENGGEQVQLISYGMTKVDLKGNNGEKLQLADGKPATLTFPVPEKFKNNTPEEIPLWSFNEQTGLWEEEGVAKYNASLNAYVGTVKHFSWVNLDYPLSRATLKITVKNDKDVVIPNVKVDIDGQRSVFTNVNGVAELYVPINATLYVTVHSRDYGNYEGEVKQTVEALTAGGQTKEVEIILPALPSISGKVTNTGVGGNITTLWLEYDGKETAKIHSDKDGKFYMQAPDYKGAAVLKVRAIDGTTASYDITLDGKDQAFNIAISGATTTGGKATFTMKDGSGSYNMAVPNVSFEDLSGLSIIGDQLSLNLYAGDYETGSYGVDLSIFGYSDSKKDFTNYNYSFSQNIGQQYLYGSLYRQEGEGVQNGKVNVTKNSDGNYRIQITGDAIFSSNDIPATHEPNATINADFTCPLLMKAKTLYKVTEKEASFPSFTPWISGLNPTAAMQITESPKAGKGVLLFFYNKEKRELTYKDYLDFKNQARKSLGEPVECNDLGDDADAVSDKDNYDVSQSVFYKNGKYILVSYCPWRDYIEEEMGENEVLDQISHMGSHIFFETHMARIHVHVLEGLTIGYDFGGLNHK